MKAEISTNAPVDRPTEMSSSLAVSPHDGASTPIEPATANRPAPGEIPVSRYSPGLRLGEIAKGIGPTPNDVPGRRGVLADDSIHEGREQAPPVRTEEGIKGVVVDRLSDTTGLPQEEVGKRLTQQPGDEDPTVGEETNRGGYVRPEGDTIPTRRERDDRVRDALTELSQGGEGEIPNSQPVTEEPELIREQVNDESAVTRRRVVVSDDPNAGGKDGEDTSQSDASSGGNGGDSEVPPIGGNGGNDSGGSDLPQEGGDDWEEELEAGIKDLKSLGVENLTSEDRKRLERALDEFETVTEQREDTSQGDAGSGESGGNISGGNDLPPEGGGESDDGGDGPHDGEEPPSKNADEIVLDRLKDLFTAARDEEPPEDVIAALKKAIETAQDETILKPYPEGDPLDSPETLGEDLVPEDFADAERRLVDYIYKGDDEPPEESPEMSAYIDARLKTYGITSRDDVGREVIDTLKEQYERSLTDQSAQSDPGEIETDPSGQGSEGGNEGGLRPIERYIEDKLRETEGVLGSRDSWDEGEEAQLAEEYRRQAMDRGITDRDSGAADVIAFPDRTQEGEVDSVPEGTEGDVIDLEETRREETLTGPERYYRLQEERPGPTDREQVEGDAGELTDLGEGITKGLVDSNARKEESVVELDNDEGLEAALAALGEEVGGMTNEEFAAEVERHYAALQDDSEPQTDELSGVEPPIEPETDQAKDANEPEDGL